MRNGFTLIEILVVIGIIAILSVLAVPNFMTARQKARDTQRKSDLRQVQSALELYKDDQAPYAYPDTLPTLAAGTNPYLKQVPTDPLNTGNNVYTYNRNVLDNLRYTLRACLENQLDPQGTNCGLCGGAGGSNKCYVVSE